MEKKRVYVDMDDVMCDYLGAHKAAQIKAPWNKYPQATYDFYRKLEPIKGAILAMYEISEYYDVWILTRPSYMNATCYTEKRLWIEDHLGLEWCKKLILCPDKSLMIGDYLIDDQPWPGFKGEQLLFGSNDCPDWISVMDKLIDSQFSDDNEFLNYKK